MRIWKGFYYHSILNNYRQILTFSASRYGNVTDVDHVRIKRGIIDTIKRIWKGFHWKLETPSMDWSKAIGGSKLGASFGLIIKNFLEIDISE